MTSLKIENERQILDTLPRLPETFTVLVADDDFDIVEVMAFFLENDGYRVLKAYDGDEALKLALQERPDLVLLDVRMPRADGYTVCRQLKANPETAFIPVVMVTHVRGLDNRVAGAEAGADDYLNKPVNEIEFTARVRALLRTKALHDELEAQKQGLEDAVHERTMQLETALQKLRSLDRLRGEIINNVSHELRTPLTQVKNAVDLIEGCTSPDEMSALISVAKNAASRLERLIKNIVELGAGLSVTLEPVSVPDSVYQAIVAMRAVHPANSIQIEAVLEPDLPQVYADRTGLVRVLQHLLDNAVKFSPGGGKVEVIAKRVNEGVWLGVCDEGIGIPKDELSNIFEQFYQVDGSSTRSYGGMGIGLSIVKLIIEGHGSEIEVKSREGKGSTFGFKLDAVESE